MKPFDIISLILLFVLVLVAVLDYKMRRDVYGLDKKKEPCSCTPPAPVLDQESQEGAMQLSTL